MIVSRYHDNICVELLGGEPTLVKNLNFIISAVSHIPAVKSIQLYTNLTTTLPVDLLSNSSNIEILATAHIDVMTPTQLSRFIRNARILLEMGPRFQIKVVGSNQQYISLIDDAKLPYIRCSIYDSNESYNGDIVDDSKFVFGSEILTAKDIINNGLNKFKGWLCYINTVYIDSRGQAFRHCYGPKCHYKSSQFPLLLQTPVTCTYDVCSNACKLEYIKILERSSGTLELRLMNT